MNLSMKFLVLACLGYSGLAAAAREFPVDGTIQIIDSDGPEWTVTNGTRALDKSFRFRVGRDFAGQKIRIEPFMDAALTSVKWTEVRTECVGSSSGGISCMVDAQGRPILRQKTYKYHRYTLAGTFICEDTNKELGTYFHQEKFGYDLFETNFSDSIRWSIDNTDCTNFRVEYQFQGQNFFSSDLELKVLAIGS